jgi:CRISPR-associated endonuclease/helicase Cas3
MCDIARFRQVFHELTGNSPFPWQEELCHRLCGRKDAFPTRCSIPTGLGKTAIIPIWLIALTENSANVPRRLVYVVNRRTVVDQATAEAEKIRERLGGDNSDALKPLRERIESLCGNSDDPLAISTLRGQLADNGEWCNNPARPAVIVGTVDMIGS